MTARDILPTFGPTSSGSARGALSIEWKLPLLITAVLAAGLAAFLAFTYVTLSRRSETVVRDRFAHASRLVATNVAEAIAQRKATFDTAARSPAIVRALTSSHVSRSDSLAAVAVLARLVGGTDSLAAILSDTRGRIVASAGKSFPSALRVIDPAAIAPASGDETLGAVHVSPLIPFGERTLFWIVAPVVSDNQRLGYVFEPRWVTGARNALENLREMTREDLTLYSRNTDGTGWTYPPSRPVPPPTRRDSTPLGVTYERGDAGVFIAEEAPVVGTPWLVVINSPVKTLFARLRTTIEQLAWMSLVLLLAGATLSWAIGRRITRPLVALTSAADEVASGTYRRPIAVASRDEVGRLASSFHEMAAQVTEARRELEQRAADAQRARGEAEAANRAKSDFLAMMSHELRTPLNAIAGYAELIELGIHGPVTDAQRDALNRIARSQAHLLTLINDVLNFARIDAGQLQYAVQDVRMNETLAGLEPLVAPQVAARRLTFTYDGCDPAVVAAADGDKVRQVVLNLLSNAVKYTPEGGTVRLRCDADATTVRVHVQDTGPGIDTDQLPVIFEPFVQGHRALNRPNEGVGLGLAISRDLARGMSGDVKVSTQLGVGSTFTLELPRVGVAPGPAATAFAATSPGSVTVA